MNRPVTRGATRVTIVPLETLAQIREELERVSAPGVNVFEKAAVVSWAAQFADAYFYTRKGALRRVFPKGSRPIAFPGKGAARAAREDQDHAAGKPQADALRDQ